MSYLADRLVDAAELNVVDIRDAYPRNPKDAPSEEVAARAVVAVLRELATEWRGAMLGFGSADEILSGLADEIEQG